MEQLLNFLQNLLDRGLLIPFTIIITVGFLGLISVLIVGLKPIIKYFSKKKFGVKLGDKEFQYDGSDDDILKMNSIPPESQIKKVGSAIVSIVNYSIENGYESCKVRQQLFDIQMHTIHRNFELVTTSILNTYIQNKGKKYDVIKVLLNQALETKVINPLRQICIADRLAEKTKEQVVELERSFIDNAYNDVKLELIRLAQSVHHSEGDKLVSQDTILLKSLEEHQTLLKKEIIDSLEKAFDAAVKFLNVIYENNKTLNTKITNVVEQLLENNEDLPTDWLIGSNTTPPVDILGDS